MIRNIQKMKKLLNRILQMFYNNYIWSLLGFLLLVLYIWGRFLRIRLPRDIPFTLNTFAFIILLFICFIYVYSIYRILKPKIPPQVISDIIYYISLSLKSLDDYLKSFSFISNFYKKVFIYLANRIDDLNFKRWEKIIFFINLFPHVILLFIFFLDLFYFRKLYYFYKVLWVSVILFIIPICLHSFLYVKDLMVMYWMTHSTEVMVPYVKDVLPPHLDYWHEDYDDTDDDINEPPETMFINFETFIKLYFEHSYYPEKKIDNFHYIVFPTQEWQEDFLNKNNLKKEIYSSVIATLEADFIKKEINLIIKLCSICNSYEILISFSQLTFKIKVMKICVLTLYLIGWLYILSKSTSIQNIIDLLSLGEYISFFIENPFSGEKTP